MYLDRAIEDLARAVEVDGQLAIAYYSRALAYGLEGDGFQVTAGRQ